jgi:hypothetical protein
MHSGQFQNLELKVVHRPKEAQQMLDKYARNHVWRPIWCPRKNQDHLLCPFLISAHIQAYHLTSACEASLNLAAHSVHVSLHNDQKWPRWLRLRDVDDRLLL